MHPVSIIGCGYTGSRLAQRLVEARSNVCGYATREESMRQVSATGARAAALNLDRPLDATIDLNGHLVYYSVPPAPDGERDPRLERLLQGIAGIPLRIVYLSTTGVYGDRGGGVVDEETEPQPLTARAIRRLCAENALRDWADSRAVSWSILRIPGIYGPGRLPLERLRRREPAIEPGEATPGNRIQVDDLVTACCAAGVAQCAHRRIYNITDGTDDSQTRYLQRVARIVDLPLPPLISRATASTTLSATAWSFLGESRKVDNRRMLHELGVALAYHDLDAGIRASL